MTDQGASCQQALCQIGVYRVARPQARLETGIHKEGDYHNTATDQNYCGILTNLQVRLVSVILIRIYERRPMTRCFIEYVV